MKFKHIAAVLAGAAALSAPSCDLNEKFYSEVTPDTFFTSPESTYAVLCRPFTHWKWYIGADRWYLQEDVRPPVGHSDSSGYLGPSDEARRHHESE